jgi:hypothetical protein
MGRLLRGFRHFVKYLAISSFSESFNKIPVDEIKLLYYGIFPCNPLAYQDSFMPNTNFMLAVISVLKDNSGTITEFLPIDVKSGNVRHVQFQTAQGLHDLGEHLQRNVLPENRVAACQIVSIENDESGAEFSLPLTGRIFFDAAPVDARFTSPTLPVHDKHEKMMHGETPKEKALIVSTRLGDLFHSYASDIVVHDFGAGGNSMNQQRYFCMGLPAIRQNIAVPDLYYAEWVTHGKRPEFV